MLSTDYNTNRMHKREADTILTDSVPTDAIPTIHSQDDHVHLVCLCRKSRNLEKIGGGRGFACIESTALIEAPRGVGRGDGIPVGSRVPPPEKLQCTSKAPTQLYCP